METMSFKIMKAGTFNNKKMIDGALPAYYLPFWISVNVKRGLHVCRGLGTMENTSTKWPAQPSPAHQCQRLYNQLHRHLAPDRGPPPSTPAEMETNNTSHNIDKIKCTFIACQSRKITRLMKIFKGDFCPLLLSSFNDIIRERIQCNVNVSGNLPMLNNNVMKWYWMLMICRRQPSE